MISTIRVPKLVPPKSSSDGRTRRGVLALRVIAIAFAFFVLKHADGPIRDTVREASGSVLAHGAEIATSLGGHPFAVLLLDRGMEIGVGNVQTCRQMMLCARHHGPRLWKKSSSILFFHSGSSNVDRLEILHWCLDHGEIEFFDKLISCLPIEWAERDPGIATAIRVSSGLPRGPEANVSVESASE